MQLTWFSLIIAPMDKIEFGISNRFGLRLIYVDVSETAKTLEERHLSGPASAEVLGHGLLASALLLSKVKEKDERVSFRLKVDGPIKGLLTEVGGNGDLRGYTEIKLLNDFDGAEPSDMGALMGEKGQLTIIHSNEKGAIYSGQIGMDTPDVRTAVARYFNQSEQIPTGVEFYSKLENFRVSDMKGLMVQKLPGADTEKFVYVLEKFNSHEVASRLKSASGIKDFDRLFGLGDLSLLESRSLQFNCRCSYEKSVKMLGMFSSCELQEIIQKKSPQRVTCHFCGETYRIKTEDVASLLLEKADENRPV